MGLKQRSNVNSERRSQRQRRETTQAAVLASARRLFGQQGYAATSLDQIAQDCAISVRPVYHYFGSKKALFAAVNTQIEAEWAAIIASHSAGRDAWRQVLQYLRDDQLRQIVLLDAPTVLGRERWADSAVTKAALQQFQARLANAGKPAAALQVEARMIVAALAEAAQYIAQADNPEEAQQHCEPIIERLLGAVS